MSLEIARPCVLVGFTDATSNESDGVSAGSVRLVRCREHSKRRDGDGEKGRGSDRLDEAVSELEPNHRTSHTKWDSSTFRSSSAHVTACSRSGNVRAICSLAFRRNCASTPNSPWYRSSHRKTL